MKCKGILVFVLLLTIVLNCAACTARTDEPGEPAADSELLIEEQTNGPEEQDEETSVKEQREENGTQIFVDDDDED